MLWNNTRSYSSLPLGVKTLVNRVSRLTYTGAAWWARITVPLARSRHARYKTHRSTQQNSRYIYITVIWRFPAKVFHSSAHSSLHIYTFPLYRTRLIPGENTLHTYMRISPSRIFAGNWIQRRVKSARGVIYYRGSLLSDSSRARRSTRR